eukprot:TRINITY_DN45265_c0_g1_i1.p1 TRINITY_DN45265_c0_g1~~TRINITY_DN45265_c0_g1_i1.p1  ORF type:complete len:385 (-),score=83.47 TRINITY_DN45265_c0_g1_i1:73-1227(-)
MCSKEAWEHFLFVPQRPPRRVARAAQHCQFLSVRSADVQPQVSLRRQRSLLERGQAALRAAMESGTGTTLAYGTAAAAAYASGAAPGAALLKLGMMVPPMPPLVPPSSASRPGQNGEEERAAAWNSVPSSPSFLQTMFPGFDPDTFIWRISVLQIAEYVGSLMLGSTMSSPKLCSLYLLGASWGPSIAAGAVWRLFLPIMLHANVLHIFFNLFFQMRIGFGMEKQFGRKKFCMLYLFCGFFGNLLSVVRDPMKLAVGASTSGFGLLGVWAAEVMLTWHLLGESRSRVFLWFAFMFLSCGVMSQLSPNVDFAGHFGGALGGFLFSLMFADMEDEHQPPWYHTAKKWARWVASLIVFGGLTKAITFGPDGPIPFCGAIFHPRVLPF